MAATFSRLFRLGDYWVAWSLLIGCGVTVASTLVYFSWATSPLRQVKIAEIVGQPGNQVLVNRQPVTTGATVSTGQQILTLQTAKVSLQQANQVLARLGTQSSAILESDCIQLGEGQLVVSSTAGCLGAAIVRSQDGIFVLQRLGTLGEVKVLSGEVSLSVPSNPTLGTITLRANQKLTLSLTGDELGPIRLMLPTEIDSLVASDLFQGFQQALANQSAIAGLLPPPAPSPSPGLATKPTPAKPLNNPSPTDKVPPTRANDQPPSSPYIPASSRASSGWDENTSHDPDNGATPAYPRSTRRRRYVEPSYESYTYRRKWPRSTYTSNYARRRPPSYSTPSYSAPAHPEPSSDLPTVPEAPAPEIPTPIELPPATPPATDSLPPPVLVEPPLEAPVVK